MRVSDLISGTISTIQVERIEDEPFSGSIQNTMELLMSYDEHSDEVIISVGKTPFSIEATTHKDKAKLNKIVKRGFPKIVWLADTYATDMKRISRLRKRRDEEENRKKAYLKNLDDEDEENGQSLVTK